MRLALCSPTDLVPANRTALQAEIVRGNKSFPIGIFVMCPKPRGHPGRVAETGPAGLYVPALQQHGCEQDGDNHPGAQDQSCLPGLQAIRNVLGGRQRLHGVAWQVFAGFLEEVPGDELERNRCHEEDAHQAHNAAGRIPDQRPQGHPDGGDGGHIDAVDQKELHRLGPAKVQLQSVVVQDRHRHQSCHPRGGSRDHERSHHDHHQLGTESREAAGNCREGGPCHSGSKFRTHQQHAKGAENQLGEGDAGRRHADGKVSALCCHPGSSLRVPGGRIGELARPPCGQRAKANHHDGRGGEQDQGRKKAAELDDFRVEHPDEGGPGKGASGTARVRSGGGGHGFSGRGAHEWATSAAGREWYSTSSLVSSIYASSRLATRGVSSYTMTWFSRAVAAMVLGSRPVTSSNSRSGASMDAPRPARSWRRWSGWSVRTRTRDWPFPVMMSRMGASAMTRPRPMTTKWSAVCAISLIRWLERNTVRPCPARYRTRLRTHTTPSGSRPLTGSSRMSVCGSPSRAAAIPRRWPMPSENPPAFFRATASSPVISITSCTRALGMLWVAAMA